MYNSRSEYKLQPQQYMSNVQNNSMQNVKEYLQQYQKTNGRYPDYLAHKILSNNQQNSTKIDDSALIGRVPGLSRMYKSIDSTMQLLQKKDLGVMDQYTNLSNPHNLQDQTVFGLEPVLNSIEQDKQLYNRMYRPEHGFVLRLDFITGLQYNYKSIQIFLEFFLPGNETMKCNFSQIYQLETESYNTKRCLPYFSNIFKLVQSPSMIMYIECWGYQQKNPSIDDQPYGKSWTKLEIFNYNNALQVGKHKLPFYVMNENQPDKMYIKESRYMDNSFINLRLSIPNDPYLDQNLKKFDPNSYYVPAIHQYLVDERDQFQEKDDLLDQQRYNRYPQVSYDYRQAGSAKDYEEQFPIPQNYKPSLYVDQYGQPRPTNKFAEIINQDKKQEQENQQSNTNQNKNNYKDQYFAVDQHYNQHPLSQIRSNMPKKTIIKKNNGNLDPEEFYGIQKAMAVDQMAKNAKKLENDDIQNINLQQNNKNNSQQNFGMFGNQDPRQSTDNSWNNKIINFLNPQETNNQNDSQSQKTDDSVQRPLFDQEQRQMLNEGASEFNSDEENFQKLDDNEFRTNQKKTSGIDIREAFEDNTIYRVLEEYDQNPNNRINDNEKSLYIELNYIKNMIDTKDLKYRVKIVKRGDNVSIKDRNGGKCDKKGSLDVVSRKLNKQFFENELCFKVFLNDIFEMDLEFLIELYFYDKQDIKPTYEKYGEIRHGLIKDPDSKFVMEGKFAKNIEQRFQQKLLKSKMFLGYTVFRGVYYEDKNYEQGIQLQLTIKSVEQIQKNKIQPTDQLYCDAMIIMDRDIIQDDKGQEILYDMKRHGQSVKQVKLDGLSTVEFGNQYNFNIDIDLEEVRTMNRGNLNLFWILFILRISTKQGKMDLGWVAHPLFKNLKIFNTGNFVKQMWKAPPIIDAPYIDSNFKKIETIIKYEVNYIKEDGNGNKIIVEDPFIRLQNGAIKLIC
ncbi:hypothetical protein PPERSA_10204 [Pseudocohnilembus persalinus]|uniref:Uncharacterized protein n=1 Tax=Pseudocohnilembus persalinus TaxID=266149 RepID=A0A0V0QLB4_PSEPJ|nr:hypothetical protein PPERSA_10204 [Pseudocohnilembus persalinus]|eukprot:KRX03123.1 hypothetical protein PPERSA_10204 [Pseudocohnilembus persalinus]